MTSVLRALTKGMLRLERREGVRAAASYFRLCYLMTVLAFKAPARLREIVDYIQGLAKK